MVGFVKKKMHVIQFFLIIINFYGISLKDETKHLYIPSK